MLARLVVSALGAIVFQTLVAGEPAASTAPAQSIREWMTKPSPTPAAGPATMPTAQALVAGTPVGTTPPAKSIREWMTTPSPTLGPCPTASPIANLSATPAANPPAGPAGSAAAPTSPIKISFTSTLRQGNLVVVLDDVPIFNEKFQKPLLLISQTTTWNPLQVAAGTHRLSATVYGTKKTYFSKTYDLHLSRTKGAALRFVMQGDKLTVALAS
jgi:hypothetical protein